MFLVAIAVQILLTWLLYKVDFRKAFSVWIIAVLISIGIGVIVAVLVAILAGTAAVDLYNTIMQQFSFLPLFL
jgi:multisubunit Na+/H+ antiporter MnhB subunit